MNRYRVLFVLSFVTEIICRKNCEIISRPLKYYRIRECKKSSLPMVSWSYVSSLKECISFAERKRGLAFNYSPRQGNEYINGSLRNCQILGCPQIGMTDNFVSDVAFDYYSSFGYINSSYNTTCIKNIGMFALISEKKNHTDSITSCKLFRGDLADVSSEQRTKYLSDFLNASLEDWYKVAYVGMDDIRKEGKFLTASGSPLNCGSYRAWAPGHPRSMNGDEDCVVLDSDNLWRVVTCSTKLPVLCELFPGRPSILSFYREDCQKIKDEPQRKICEQQHSILKQLRNSTRLEKCNILNNNTLF